MSQHTTIRVNFGRPMPVFPLHVAVLMPHAIAPLEIFEPRYRQMVSDALDGAGLIAMAVFSGPEQEWKKEYQGRPALRPAVCIGHIAEHFRYPDGRYAIVLQGICRGRIVRELPPGGVGGVHENKLYREAMIEPLGVESEDETELGTSAELRDKITHALDHGPLADLRLSKEALRHLKNPEIPTSVIVEFLGANLPERHTDVEARYQWLAAADPGERAKIVTKRLNGLESLLRRAAPQRAVDSPKGCCWN
ncbi:MAG: LON peptidase substrate-binding domain-containing protein [Phycisphaerales bacterium]|nr:LON peptidase substrate-binding domain-containing protein [Phycisphaerales bacterium]